MPIIPSLIILTLSNFPHSSSTCNKTPGPKCWCGHDDVSSRLSLHPHVFTRPRTTGGGGGPLRPAWPGPVTTQYRGLSHCPALRAWRTLIVSWEWNCVMRTDRWHQCIIIINEQGSLSIVMGLCLNQLVSLRQGLMRIIKKPISQSLRRVFGCYLTQDQFYLLLFFYRALKLSLCWWWYRVL